MTQFIMFAFYLCLNVLFLIVGPIALHPTLPMRHKILIMLVSFLIVVPGGLALYAWLGAPQMVVF